MTDPVSAAVVGSVTSQVAKEALNWLKSRGAEVSEDDWKMVGYQIGNELLAIREQFRTQPKVLPRLESELRSAWKTYEKLTRVGEDFGFDEDFLEHYRTLTEKCNEWSDALANNENDGLYGEDYEDEFDKYKKDVLSLMK